MILGVRTRRNPTCPMTDLQTQARALGDPTRYSIFRYLTDGDRPVDVAELTEHFALNHNAIRQHLAKLVAAELVIESTAAISGPGRPRLTYSINPAADSRWGVSGPYERLSVLLTELIRTGASAEEVGRNAGRRQRVQDEASPADVVGQLREAMEREGFDPEVRQRGNRVDVILRSCPFASAALADPDTICALHRGMAEGLAEHTPVVVVDELVPKDPRRAHCRLRLHLEDPPD